jgi:hypothetical protein
MIRRVLVVALLSIVALASSVKAQQAETTQDGRHIVRFTPGQQAAIDQFLSAHPNMLQANCTTLGLAPETCTESYKEWDQIVMSTKAIPQSPYAAWGNYSHHASPDLVIPFFSKTNVNNWGWRGWQIVVFEAIGPDRYLPLVALKSSWGACFDGMLYHPVRKRVEFWCNSMGGSISWNGKTFVGEIVKGD